MACLRRSVFCCLTIVLLWSYYSRMKKKASISISASLLRMIDRLPDHPPRSAVIEEALILYFKTGKAKARDKSDLEILNARSEALNQEALDALEYQSG